MSAGVTGNRSKIHRYFLLGFVCTIIFAAVFIADPADARLTIQQAPKVLDVTTEPTGVEKRSVNALLSRVLSTMLSSAGLLFFILMVYGGMVWMTAQGNDERVEKGRKIVTAAIIGLALMVGSLGITNFIQNRLIQGQISRSSIGSGGDLDSGPQGCCIDWVARDAADPDPIPACRVTTQADCEFQGSRVDNYDKHACPSEGMGCFLFFRGEAASASCNNACHAFHDKWYSGTAELYGDSVDLGVETAEDAYEWLVELFSE